MRLQGKTTIITGAAGMLGHATARLFAAEGAQLVLMDREISLLQKQAANFDPSICEIIKADAASAADMAQIAERTLDRFGAIDFFFANAGIEGQATDFFQYPDETFDQVMEVNVKGVYLGIKMMLPHMNDGASILITSSIAGLMGMPLNVAYTTSKHAVIGIRRACAAIGGKRGIRVNSLHPGFVDSAMLRRLVAQHPNSEASLRALKDRALLGRLVQPEEIAKAALFLASDESRAITNQGLVVDCGVVN